MNAKSEKNNSIDLKKLAVNIAPKLKSNASIIVIGAGAFGGWTSLWLSRKGFKVTNIDIWGPGNSSSSSGGETRLIRSIYGSGSIYTRMATRAHQLWLENEKKFGRQLFFPTGALWFVKEKKNSEFMDSSLMQLKEMGLDYEKLTLKEARKRYPLLQVADLSTIILEKKAGYLLAKDACQSVIKAFVSEGGAYLQSEVKPGVIKNKKLNSLILKNGSLEADTYVFACGPWISDIFPGILKNIITITRQEVFYFGLPPNVASAFENNLPPWLDLEGADRYYGFPDIHHRGFKIAAHNQGETFDPTKDDRVVSNNELEKAREYLSFRFPLLKNLLLVESRVCQYSNTPDENFILDLLPGTDNVWILGGGSGHGFKHGPSLGEIAAAAIAGERPVPDEFSLNRFDF